MIQQTTAVSSMTTVAAPIAKRVFDAYLLGKYDDAPVPDAKPDPTVEESR